MSLNQLTYNLELWFWSVVINVFSSSANRVQLPRIRSRIGIGNHKMIRKAVISSVLGLTIGFILGTLFL